MDTNDKGGAKISLRSIGSLFGETWKRYAERWRVLVEIVLLPILVSVLGYVLLSLGTPFSILGGLAIFIGWIILAFSTLPVIFAIHHDAGVDESYKATIGWFWPFVWVAILEVLAVMGASIMLVIPGIWLAVSLSFVAYVFVIEQRRGIDALRQSKDYIKGYWWPVIGRALLLSVVVIVPTIIIEIPFTVALGRTAGSIVSLLINLFFVPYSAIYSYLIFQNLRELKPDMAAEKKKTGRGFIITSAIVGIAVPVLAAIALIIVAAVGTAYVVGHPAPRLMINNDPVPTQSY